MPPVQAGCEVGSMSSRSVSPGLPQVVRVSNSLPSVMILKEAINRAYETTLSEGVLFERRVFHSLFATEDQKEGMAAFVEKRKPAFKHR